MNSEVRIKIIGDVRSTSQHVSAASGLVTLVIGRSRSYLVPSPLFDLVRCFENPSLAESARDTFAITGILQHSGPCHFSNCEPQTDVQHHAAEHDDPLISCNTFAPQRMLATLLLHDHFRGKSSKSLLIGPKKPTCCFIDGYEVQYIPLLN